MSRFFSKKYKDLVPYVPGEQPQDRSYIKLNTNESPFQASPGAQAAVAEAATRLQLYSDPECRLLRQKAAALYGISPDEVIFTNGSDELLNFVIMAFCDADTPAVFPDITYGFYKVFAQLNAVPYTQIPLMADFSVNVSDYIGCNKTILIANPNAPTGLALSLADVEKIVAGNPDNLVLIDEAYVDFGGQTAVPLIRKYDNLLIAQTFSKSRSMAGARLGMAIGCPALIQDLKNIQFSTNPFNVNAMTMAAGVGALEDAEYFKENCAKIIANRQWTIAELDKIGFTTVPSQTNFILTKNPAIGGKALYLALKEKGVLVRHFDTDRLRDYVRVTIGTAEQMGIFVATVKQILEENV
ncbi:MAG: histidinol-phosphate transaminase [Oscillospiraceae bacterium]|nr:histidinol-phosphate transaminase [Oscillospiraceae bacterium]MBQ9929321.1 histidinol-phosphate transaminase [Oscillospiraceae bacterium]